MLLMVCSSWGNLVWGKSETYSESVGGVNVSPFPLDFCDQPAVNAHMHGARTFAIVAALLCLLPAWLPASSKIPISYVPRRVMTAIRGYVPGAQIVKAEIGSDDTWGRTHKCDYVVVPGPL
jgi:hypothetical protein